MDFALDVVVLAAGKGTRMQSRLPKVLQRLGGQPLLAHVLQQAAQLQARQAVVVTGHEAGQVEAALADWGAALPLQLRCVRQQPQLGTGHAVQQALPLLPDDGVTLVLSGDVPLTEAATLRALLDVCAGQQLALLTLRLPDPSGYGRIERAPDGSVQAIVEHKDASPAQLGIDEIYSGIMAAPTRLLRPWLAQLDKRNAQGEYYLTDVVRHARAAGCPVQAHRIDDALQVAGVNSPAQLAELERALQRRHAEHLMAQGVRLADPARLDVRGRLHCGQDVEIDVNCIFEGEVHLGDGVRIGANCVIAQARIADGAQILPFTHIDGQRDPVQVGAGALVGPFARLRPGTRLGPEVHIGNFVEVKNSTLAAGAKANHLAYLGDATVGERVNYGAGSITANYDGAAKHRTVIEPDVHVGSNCVLVAPITLGAGGTIGAGSTLSKSTAPGALTVARGKAISLPGWQRPKKG
ncbi:MAG: bifunctional UDP-N-acetylglucosamine diphosphorylase/glucosamine-1-phosphate N-acetyltransferase GlmU [Xanthomonadaceae bacterium]|jgi:bifunctional UDP-N-acetylglucosamine pyrophosphorylase/glucosamine-1-phosphate N-acetyltransferase|nr:bifunctional UDP-N-acetylglucosamine diphosphorylase/glucosamine-1-phosphate N-acetyltransferase GlmU [Xanthomonadaceae bacterium]